MNASKDDDKDLNKMFHTFLNHTRDMCLCLSKDLEILIMNQNVVDVYHLEKKNYNNQKITDVLIVDKKLMDFFHDKVRLVNNLKDNKKIVISTFVNNSIIHWNVNSIWEKNDLKEIYLIGYLQTVVPFEQVANKNFSLENMIAHLPGNVYWMDMNCIHLGCNNNVLKMLGLTKEQYIGATYEELAEKVGWVHGEAESFKQDDLEVLRTGLPKFNVEEPPIKHVNGKIYYYLTTRVPLKNQAGEVVGVAGISTDITERKKLEQQLIETIESKSTFLSIASHEIKGSLTNAIYISMMVENAFKNKDWSKLEKLMPLIDAARNDATRGIDTINYLLDFLNLDLTGTSLKEPKEIALPRRMSEMTDTFEAETTKEIEFHIIKDDGFPRVVFLPKETDKMVEILIANAVKYSKQNGTINIRLSHFIKDSKKYLVIAIEDNGKGINKDALNRFFVPLLFEGKKDGERIYSAPAIKLSYIKKFVESIGGELTVASEENVGTTVALTMPYEESPSDYIARMMPASFEESELEEQTVSPRKLKFLVVEDNPVTLELLRMEIANLGHYVDAVTDGYEALKLAKDRNYEAIFLDISLPGMDGVELRDKLSRSDRDLPIIIAITSHDSKSDKEYFLNKGFVTVIGKPFSQETIFECVLSIQRVLKDMGY